jgi:putative AlgH/UPF0301 family transcriptional regulator
MALLVGAGAVVLFRFYVSPMLEPAAMAQFPDGAAGPGSQLAAGRFLVASRDLPDPNFAETVVLLIQYDDKGAAGLVINRPSEVPLSRVFEDLPEAKGRRDKVYLGGPVGRTGILALLRSKNKPEDARQVFADVYLISSKAQLGKAFSSGVQPDVFRVYVGYAGWGLGQLERELKLGAWHVFPGEAAAVFDADAGSVWPRLIERTERRIAGVLLGPRISAH